MNKKIYIHTLGCPKNDADSEAMANVLENDGFELCFEPELADIILINTCCFVNDAKEESVEAILSACELKENNPSLKVAVCGCLAQRYAEELKEEIPEADYFIGTGEIANIAKILTSDKPVYLNDINAPIDEAGRLTLYDAPYAYVKISEGCDKNCTYCIIPKLKGKHRSRKMEDILAEVETLANEEGRSEIIFVAQDTGTYGTDLYGKRMLGELILKAAEIEGVKWIRLLYVYPEEVDDELIYAYKNCDKLLKYIDIPLQHINDRILKLMNRRTSRADIEALIKKLRDEVPEIAIRSSFIAGFATETEEEVEELAEFLREAKLTRAGVFAYSLEEGTPAEKMSGHIPEEEKIRRRDMLMETQMEVSSEVLSSFVGKTLEVLIESMEEDGLFGGRSYLDSPDIDGIVYAYSNDVLEMNEYYKVKITDSTEYDLWGEVINENQ